MSDTKRVPVHYCIVCGHYVNKSTCGGCGHDFNKQTEEQETMEELDKNGDNLPWDGWNVDEPIRNLITLEFMQKLIRMRDSEDLSEELRGTSDRLLDLVMLDFHGESWKQYSDDEKVAEIDKKQLDLFRSLVVS